MRRLHPVGGHDLIAVGEEFGDGDPAGPAAGASDADSLGHEARIAERPAPPTG